MANSKKKTAPAKTQTSQPEMPKTSLHEGLVLKSYLKSRKLSPNDFAQQIGISKMNVYYQMERQALTKTFKNILKSNDVDIFQPPIPLDTDSKKSPINTRLEAEIRQKDEIILTKDETIQAQWKEIDALKSKLIALQEEMLGMFKIVNRK